MMLPLVSTAIQKLTETHETDDKSLPEAMASGLDQLRGCVTWLPLIEGPALDCPPSLGETVVGKVEATPLLML
jgi:hypothetical protein